MHNSFFRLVSDPGRPGGAGRPGARLRCGVRPTHALVHTEQVVNLEWGPNLGWLYRHEPSLLSSTPSFSPSPVSPLNNVIIIIWKNNKISGALARPAERPQHLCFRWTRWILGSSDISISCCGSQDQGRARSEIQRRMAAPNAVWGVSMLFPARIFEFVIVGVFEKLDDALVQIECWVPTAKWVQTTWTHVSEAHMIFFTPCTYTSSPLDGMARNFYFYLHGYARARY